MKKEPTWLLLKWYIVGIILLLALAALCSSCEVLKTKRRVTTDSTSVSKLDSTILKKLEALNRKDCTYYKETILFGRDTTINNITTPIHNYYPTQVIREGGTFSREDYLKLTDSMSRQKADSTTVDKVEETKDKKSGLSTTLMFFIGLGVLLLFAAIGFIMIYRLTSFIKTKI
jgi:hypothetical protein